jgi:pimeloyl-ACP methyl ester carboxylesterase
VTRHDDWGVRAERWTGIRSEVHRVRGTDVHLLRHDAAPGAPEGAPTQLLVHGLGGAATNWIEVLARFAEHGPVVAPDLPGFGRTPPPRPSASGVPINVRFVRTLAGELGLDRVVLHGNSMGGLIGVLLAELEPDLVERLVLVNPALPAPLRDSHAISPQALARFAPFVVPPVGRAVLRRMWDRSTPEGMYADTATFVHADPDRIAPEVVDVGVANLRYGREQPWRLDGFVAAATSVVHAMTVGRRRLSEAIAGLSAPTLLLWGDGDRLVGRHVIDHLRDVRPDWDAHVFEDVGHAPQVEAPDDYVRVVADWFAAGDDAPEVASVDELAQG